MTAPRERGPILSPGAVLQSRYRIIRLHDQGGSATVYLAERLGVEETVPLAVKELNPDAFGLAEFKNEVNALYSLNHPNLPKVYDFFEQDGHHYLVMDFVQGKTLKQRVIELGPLPEEQALDYAAQVAGILRYLHGRAERRIIHRDVKPSNLMLTKAGQVKLLDFGIARVPDTRLPGNHLHAYTEDYASPEQKANRPTDERSDIYSFGVTLHFLLTGVTPGGQPSATLLGPDDTTPVPKAYQPPESPGAPGPKVSDDTTAPVPSASLSARRPADGEPPRVSGPLRTASATGETSSRRPGLSRDVRRIIGRCLRAAPAERYQSFAELARDIEGYRRAKRTRLMRVLGIAAAVIALGAVGLTGKLIFRPSLYPVVGPSRVEAGSSITLQVGLPAAWSASLDSIVWQVEDTQSLGRTIEAQKGRYFSFSSTDLGVFEVQAYVETDGKSRPLSDIRRVEVYPALRVPSEVLAGQPTSLRSPGATAAGGRSYSYSWIVKGPAPPGGGQSGPPPVVLDQGTETPRCPLALTVVGTYTAQVAVTVKPERGLEVTVTGKPVTVSCVTEVVVDPAKIINGNSSFEQRFGSAPVDWTLIYLSHLTYDRSQGRTGSCSLRFLPWTGKPVSYAVQLVPLRAGADYRLTAWVKGEALAEGAAITVEVCFRSSINETYVLPSESVALDWTGSFDWRQVMLQFAVPPGDPVNLEVYLKYSGAGTIWFDDCAVERQ
jgi:serine/threonine protein kinase